MHWLYNLRNGLLLLLVIILYGVRIKFFCHGRGGIHPWPARGVGTPLARPVERLQASESSATTLGVFSRVFLHGRAEMEQHSESAELHTNAAPCPRDRANISNCSASSEKGYTSLQACQHTTTALMSLSYAFAFFSVSVFGGLNIDGAFSHPAIATCTVVLHTTVTLFRYMPTQLFLLL